MNHKKRKIKRVIVCINMGFFYHISGHIGIQIKGSVPFQQVEVSLDIKTQIFSCK